MASIIMLIVVLSSIALSRPISPNQFENVSRLSHQATFPETQEMALDLILENQISYIDYFRLMQAHQFEQNRAKQLRHWLRRFNNRRNLIRMRHALLNIRVKIQF